MAHTSIQTISVIVPKNPFAPSDLKKVKHCLAALNVEKLMEWWPGTPHVPHRNPKKVKDIQRSLDWKRVVQIAAYLLQSEILNAPDLINKYFKNIYGPKAGEPGREWPPKVAKTIGYQTSEFPTFSNVLLHVNGAEINEISKGDAKGTAKLEFREDDVKLNFTVIDGQHRINGAYLAIQIKKQSEPEAEWEIPAEIFLNLDKVGDEPQHQAQIFIDVNFNQKKVDKSLVADLFPTARGGRTPLTDLERAQDIGRKLMLEFGPLVGMVQIPGIRYGVQDVIALATLNAAIEEVLDVLVGAGIKSLEAQAEYIAQFLDAWLEATGRKISSPTDRLTKDNVAYQGRFIASALTLISASILKLKESDIDYISDDGRTLIRHWLKHVMTRAKLLTSAKFLSKDKMRAKRFLGTGGIALFRDTLWAAAIGNKRIPFQNPDKLAELAQSNRAHVSEELGEG